MAPATLGMLSFLHANKALLYPAFLPRVLMSINDRCIGIWASTTKHAELAVATIVETDEGLWFKEIGISVAE